MPENTIETMNVPVALQQLIVTSNKLLSVYKQEFEEQIQNANIEMMQLLQLNPADGWKLDASSMRYFREIPEQ